MEETIDRMDALIQMRKPAYIVTPNVDHIVRLQKQDEFSLAYREASLVVPDGMPLLWAARFLGESFKERVAGSDLASAQCPRAVQKGYKIFLLGGRPQSAEKAAKKLREGHPGLQITGLYCPPHGFEKNLKENEKIMQKVREASPDILLVALGTPKQEIWIYRYYKELGVPMTIGIGAGLDFLAGAVRRAPAFMRKTGFEWLWRLILEPGRLWKRYLVDDSHFFWLILKQKLSQY